MLVDVLTARAPQDGPPEAAEMVRWRGGVRYRRDRHYRSPLARSLGAPLANVRARADAIATVYRAPRYRAYAERIGIAVDHLERILANLGGEDAPRIRSEQIALTGLLDEAFRILAPEIDDKSIRISVHAGEDFVVPDRLSLRQIVLNILSNAVKFNPVGGAIDVRADIVGDISRISVTDRGPGVARDARERIFGRFERLQPNVAGVGIGLAIARAAAERLGGRLYVLDTDPQDDTGATFILELPRTDGV
ncbi:MAG: HAMP domain-containing sensor histidine kinase [Pseudomonadota bacterium]